jgi:hypothetical protein
MDLMMDPNLRTAKQRLHRDIESYQNAVNDLHDYQRSEHYQPNTGNTFEDDVRTCTQQVTASQREYDKRRTKLFAKAKKLPEPKPRQGRKQKPERYCSQFWTNGYESDSTNSGEEMPLPPRAPAPPGPVRPTDTLTAAKWRPTVSIALVDRSTMTVFPDPPSRWCPDLTCRKNSSTRKLAACPHNLEKTLSADPAFPDSLKVERLRWHPDKFSKCPEDVRELFRAKASEIFVVVNRLYQQEGKKERRSQA